MNIPEFPATVGEAAAVEFVKDGATYRLQRLDSDTLVIHRAGMSREQFELVLSDFTRDGNTFNVDGHTAPGVSLGALGATRALLFGKLF